MKLKEKILEILAKKNFTYTQLSDYLGLSEKDLDYALEHNTLEIRTLELISKELRIPLYSFFRNPFDEDLTQEERYYIENIWKAEAAKSSDSSHLIEEIKKLKADIAKKDKLIAELTKSSKKN